MKNKTCGECRHLECAKKIGFCQKMKYPLCPAEIPSCANFEQKIITNGDKIQQMSNEKLAELFATLTDCGNCDDCPVKDYCTTECCDPIPAWIAYLNAPAESEVEDE